MWPPGSQTTINDTRDFGIGKRLTNLPALRQAGFTASRRLLGAQKLSHDPITGAGALAQVTDPVITPAGTRVAGLRLTDPRSPASTTGSCAPASPRSPTPARPHPPPCAPPTAPTRPPSTTSPAKPASPPEPPAPLSTQMTRDHQT
jgi:hypothetical protein